MQSSFDYYTHRAENPVVDLLSSLPRGKDLKDLLESKLPPIPDERVRSFPAEKRLSLLTVLKEIHVPTGRDIALADLVYEMLDDSYAARPFTGERLRQDSLAVKDFATAVKNDTGAILQEPLGGALIGMPAVGKTRTIKRVFANVPQWVKTNPELDPLLPPLVIVWLLVECPANRSVTALVTAILDAIEAAIGSPLPKEFRRGNESQLVANIGALCRHFCVGMLVVDEIQHALNGRGNPDQKFLNFFVQLGNTLKVPVLLVGTPLARRVVGGAMRQARRMLGPEWLNMRRDSPAWSTFSRCLISYQFTQTLVAYEAVEPALYEYSQGLPGLAVTLWRISQRCAIHLESEPDRNNGVTADLIRTVYADFFVAVHPMIAAIKSGDASLMEIYQDLSVDPEKLERELAEDAREQEKALRAELYKTRRAALKKAKKIVTRQVQQEAQSVTPPQAPTERHNRPLLDAYDQAKDEGEDPGAAVAAKR